MLEQYYFGQGKVFSRPFGVTGAGGWRWWGDVSELQGAGASEKVQHKESFSGKKGKVRSIPVGNDMTVTGTLHQVDTEALAMLLNGTVTTVAGGAVVGEVLGEIAVGDIIKLDYPGVSDLVVTDSLGTPATIADTNYDLDPRFGSFEFLSLPTSPAPTMPLKAGYSYSGYKQVSYFTSPPPILQFRYEGVNLAEGEAPVIAEWYKVATEALKQLSLINNGNTLGGLPFSLEALQDTSKPVSGTLGRFGRFIQVTQP